MNVKPLQTQDAVSVAMTTNDVELQTILTAWQTATDRLQKTHELLRDEVRRLTDELEAKNRELARKNRLADLGQMASHVAHEVRNNLVPMTLYLSLLRRHVSDAPVTLEVVDKINAGFTALESTVNDLLHFTSDREPQCSLVNVQTLVNEVCESLKPQFSAQCIEVDVEIDPQIHLSADRNMLRRGILNLTLNAIDAMPEGGELMISAVHTWHGVELEVSDSGPGLSDRELQRLFEPFYSTKSDGTGLGLAIVDRIAEVHGGTIAASNCPQGGAAFTLSIPYRTMEAAA